MPQRTIAPYRLQQVSYPVSFQIDTQYSDLDVNAHINNVAISRFYESARVRAHLQIFDDPRFFQRLEYGVFLVESRLRFLQEGHFPEPVTVGIGIGHIGNTSYIFEQGLFQNGECIGIGDAVMVLTQDSKPCPIPTDIRSRMQDLELPRVP